MDDLLEEQLLITATYRRHIQELHDELTGNLQKGQSLVTVAHVLMRIEGLVDEVSMIKDQRNGS